MYHIMKNDPSYATGAHKIGEAHNRQSAERKARAFDSTLNGKPMRRTFVLSQKEYDDWHNSAVMPFYS